ncbi:MAG TPA: NAD(P)H-binding protein [Terriglobales bacterium]|nr:NAD(P)H-binding protein [Terriglobales bacterium]
MAALARTSHVGDNSIFIAGGTGYIGRPLIQQLVARGHQVRALVRSGSEKRLPAGCEPVPGNALDPSTYSDRVAPSQTFVQLVGVSHPIPSKTAEFQAIDRTSALGAVQAARDAGIQHFIYLSVAQPAPVMKSYIAVRAECEQALLASRMNVTVVRPWYVLGPGHRWPYALLPMYWLCERIPATRESARRLGLVTLAEMVRTLVSAIENPSVGARFIEVPQIRSGSVSASVPLKAASSA